MKFELIKTSYEHDTWDFKENPEAFRLARDAEMIAIGGKPEELTRVWGRRTAEPKTVTEIGYTIELETMQDLLDWIEKTGKADAIVQLGETEYHELPRIEYYNDYRE